MALDFLSLIMSYSILTSVIVLFLFYQESVEYISIYYEENVNKQNFETEGVAVILDMNRGNS